MPKRKRQRSRRSPKVPRQQKKRRTSPRNIQFTRWKTKENVEKVNGNINKKPRKKNLNNNKKLNINEELISEHTNHKTDEEWSKKGLMEKIDFVEQQFSMENSENFDREFQVIELQSELNQEEEFEHNKNVEISSEVTTIEDQVGQFNTEAIVNERPASPYSFYKKEYENPCNTEERVNQHIASTEGVINGPTLNEENLYGIEDMEIEQESGPCNIEETVGPIWFEEIENEEQRSTSIEEIELSLCRIEGIENHQQAAIEQIDEQELSLFFQRLQNEEGAFFGTIEVVENEEQTTSFKIEEDNEPRPSVWNEENASCNEERENQQSHCSIEPIEHEQQESPSSSEELRKIFQDVGEEIVYNPENLPDKNTQLNFDIKQVNIEDIYNNVDACIHEQCEELEPGTVIVQIPEGDLPDDPNVENIFLIGEFLEDDNMELELNDDMMIKQKSPSNDMEQPASEDIYVIPDLIVEETNDSENEEEIEESTPGNFTLPSQLLSEDDITRIQKMFDGPKLNNEKKLVKLERIIDMGTVKVHSEDKLLNVKSKPRALLCPLVSQYFYNVKTNDVDQSCIQFTASFRGFRPTVSSNYPDAVAMCSTSMNIGRGSHNHVDLDLFGYCNFTSPLHAVLFYDESARKFELLNYSPYGTLVNNVMYGINTSLNRPLERLYGWYSGRYERKVYTKVYRRCRPNMTRGCLCDREDIVNSSEETILLRHGAAISFGCIPFIFSTLKNTY